jgi:hypothetical protein
MRCIPIIVALAVYAPSGVAQVTIQEAKTLPLRSLATRLLGVGCCRSRRHHLRLTDPVPRIGYEEDRDQMLAIQC